MMARNSFEGLRHGDDTLIYSTSEVEGHAVPGLYTTQAARLSKDAPNRAVDESDSATAQKRLRPANEFQ